MDQTEELARDFLQSLTGRSAAFEPDGRIPPDFLVEPATAVEVRRVSQLYTAGGDPQPLEHLAIPLIERLDRVSKSFGPPQTDTSWFLIVDFRRPLPRWRTLREPVSQFLTQIRDDPNATRRREVYPNLTLEVQPGSPLRDELFHLAAIHDEDSGGWVGDGVEISVRQALAEKAAKVAPYRANYSSWWLVLVDFSTYGQASFKNFTDPGLAAWDRVFVVNPLNPRSFVELGIAAV